MRFDQLQVVKEDASSDARARQQGQGLVTMSMADLYDMMNQPYPLNQRGQTLPGWFEPRTFAVGQEEGMLSPQMASAYNEWVQGGRLPGLLPDPDTGELRPYNENSYLLDFSYGFAEGAFQLAGDLTRGVAYASDTLDNFLGVSDSYHMTRAASETWMDDFADFFNNQTDLDYRDRATLMQNAIQTPGDVLSLVTGGDVWNDINFQGFGAMIATELPSEILDVALMTSGLGGIAAGIGLNAAEAGGAAVQEVFQSINRLYDEGELQQTQQWRVAQELAAESLRQQGLTEGSQEWNDRLDTLAIEVIQDSTLQSNYIRATAGTGAVLDSAADLLIYKRLGGGVIRNAMARMIAAPTIEGSDEALQQIFINRGLTDGTGVPIDEFEGAINAFYQGAVIGGAAGAAATTIDTARSIDQGRQAAQAKLRQFFFGDDYNNIRAIVQIMGMDPALLVNRVRDPNTGRLNLTGLLDTSIPTQDQLSRGQRARLARTGALNINGRRITRGQIERATRNMGLMSMLENANYDPSANRWNITYQSEDDLREVLQLFGVDTEELSTNEAMREIESILNIDMRVEGRSELEAPIWTDLNARQREEYINTGFVTQFDDPRRQGQRWTREDILDNSFSYESVQGETIVPDSIINLAMPTDARPTVENSDMAGEVADLQLQIDNNPNVFAARQDLEGDQRAWDEYANENGRDAAIEELGNRPSESDPEWQERFTSASSTTAMLQTRINQIRAEIRNEQAMWDAEYGDTHYRDGTPRIIPLDSRTSRGETPTQDDGSAPGFREPGEREVPQAPPTDDAETVDDTQDDEVVSDEPPEVMSTAPNTPAIGSDLGRAHVVYNSSLRLANGAMDPLSVRSMFERLEQTYPGITQEVLGEGGIENYVQNPAAVEEQRAEELRQNPPETPELQVGAKPPRGTELTVDGITYRFLGAMWGRVTENGTVDTGFVRRDRSNGPNNTDLTTLWQTETIPELNTAPPQTIETDTSPEVQTTGPELDQTQTVTQDSDVSTTTSSTFTPLDIRDPQDRTQAPDPENDLRVQQTVTSPEVQTTGPELDQTQTGTQDSEFEFTPTDDERVATADPEDLDIPQGSEETPVVPDQTDTETPPVDVQTTGPELDQTQTGTRDSEFDAPEPQSDLRRDDVPLPRPEAPRPETSLRRDDTETSPVDVQTDGPQLDQTQTGTQDSEFDADTTTDTTVDRTTPPELTRPELDTGPTVDTTTDQTRDQEQDGEQETDQTRDQEQDQEQDREQQTEPQDDRTQDAPINIVDPDVTVATTTAVGTRDPNAQTGARTTGTRDQRRTPRPGGTGAVTPPKFDFGKLKPVQVADPEDLNKFRRVT